MALSPGVTNIEKDLSFSVQSITSNATGFVGVFRWGPVEEIVAITTNESELAQRFGQPDNATSGSFHAAANYMLYSVPLYVARSVGVTAKNAIPLDAINAIPPIAPVLVKNLDHAETVTLTDISFLGRYPGQLGNSLKVSLADNTGFSGWTYEDEFDFAPTAGKFNMVVVDEDGLISGVAGSVLERYELMTLVPGSKKTDGTSAYLPEVIKAQSNWVLVGDETAIVFTAGIYQQSLSGGVDDNNIATVSLATSYALFNNKETADIVRMFTSFSTSVFQGQAIDIADSRGDIVIFNAPALDDVYNTVNQVTNLTTYFGTTLNKPSSYSFQVDNWKLIFDKYNDKNIWIPTDSDAAGLHARLFVESQPWFSPAGLNRGQLKNVIKLAWNSNEAQRDVLYKNSINSIVAFKGEGTVLFGDKTALRAPSAFSRINVRTLFIVLKKNISNFARFQLFELNDFITRALFRNAVKQYLDTVQAGRGIFDKRVVADETNNTPAIIDANEFVGDIFIKPARSINFIRLNFIAVGTGVDFSEVEGA